MGRKKRGKKRSTASVRNIPPSNGSKNAQKIPIQRAKCQTNPPSKKNDRTSRYKTNKNIAKRWCFLSKKQKRILSSPFKTKQKFPLSNRTKKQNFALFCSCEFVLEINTPEEKTKKNLKVELKKMVFERIKHFDLEYVY